MKVNTFSSSRLLVYDHFFLQNLTIRKSGHFPTLQLFRLTQVERTGILSSSVFLPHLFVLFCSFFFAMQQFSTE